MKIFDAEQIRRWDAATMAAQNISPTTLMQRAGESCVNWIKQHFDRTVTICIICGKGGNGGDGLVIGKELMQKGYKVTLLLLSAPDDFKGATRDHWHSLQESIQEPAKATIKIINDEVAILPAIESTQAQIVIDAVLGNGFIPTTDQRYDRIKQAIQAINTYRSKSANNATTKPRKIISIDLPSGLAADNLPTSRKNDSTEAAELSQSDEYIIKADYTLSFQAYKRSFLHPETAKYLGQIHIFDISLCKSYYKSEKTTNYLTDLKDAAKHYNPRAAHAFGHKGSFGTAVLVGGSYGKIGAISLSASAALRAGAGKVFVQAPKCGYEILQTSIPEAMFEPAGESYVSELTTVKKGTYGIGPGMDTHPESVNALIAFLKEQQHPLVLDADALNILATNPQAYLPHIPKESILTPHPGEFSRLFGQSADSLEQVENARKNALQWKINIILKGHRTAVCTPEGKVYYNLSGNAGMATAGSGDVLTGVITALLAQGYKPKNAAILGVYLHGLAGDLCCKKGAQESLIASDIINYLAKAYRKLGSQNKM